MQKISNQPWQRDKVSMWWTSTAPDRRRPVKGSQQQRFQQQLGNLFLAGSDSFKCTLFCLPEVYKVGLTGIFFFKGVVVSAAFRSTLMSSLQQDSRIFFFVPLHKNKRIGFWSSRPWEGKLFVSIIRGHWKMKIDNFLREQDVCWRVPEQVSRDPAPWGPLIMTFWRIYTCWGEQ